ncbi:type 1 glutamine amidotransferase domain-containing protein [Paracoccus litorisediminis]|jgi:putative intracellular protease/amidase|uniref:Type 1 glutamine amidotransferase domain-containing protein n=1 Tax=Paracoccus litorisediminis TaxID=2006130 RepID=A0A844HNU4_9RHOB|nr:type 1 glutamine amidotransferase domain-containing protein [Paracoccus litorisediminis]MTH60779.1 type 1 glutamine amidotransferase domain-containing protein [Paracoccus litorisediminis]
MKPILIVMTSHSQKGDTGQPTGYFLSEVTHPLAVFDREGLPVAFASIKGGEPPVDGFDLEDATNARYWNDPDFRARIAGSLKLADVNPADYSAIFFAGGHGAVWDFPVSAAVNEKSRAIWEQGGVVGAVCHGPAALTNVTLADGKPLVAGRKVAAFTDAEEVAVGLQDVVPFLLSSRLAELGAQMQPGPDWTETVAVDGRLVTGQNPQSASAVGEEIAKLLKA